jgi:hypothetical protein
MKREKQRADVRTVDVGIGRDDDFVVAEFCDIEYVADRGAECDDEIFDLLGGEHFVESRSLDIENLAAKRQVSPACGDRGPFWRCRLRNLPLR